MTRDRRPPTQSPRPRIIVRETDDYVERNGPPTPPSSSDGWVRNVFQPAVVTLLVACVAWSAGHLIAELAVTWSPTLLWLTPTLMSIVGFVRQRQVREHLLSGIANTRSRLVELAIIFLLIKLLGYFDNTLPEILDDARGWAAAPLSFLDGQTMAAFGLGLAAWLAGNMTARDLDAVEDPTMYLGETGPYHRLATRYFLGGMVLLTTAGLRRVSLTSLVYLENPRVTAPIINVIVYFVLGLAMLGQVQLARMAGVWRREKVITEERLKGTWIRYTLLLLALAALAALLLPTGYTVGILDLVAMLLFVISYIAAFLYLLILWPFSMLYSLLMGRPMNAETPKLENMPLTPAVPPVDGPSSLWAVLRSILFWVILLGVIVYLVRSYLRDQRGLMIAVRRIRFPRWVIALWHALVQWLRSAGHQVKTVVPALIQRLRRTSERGRESEGRTQGHSRRQQIIYHYLRTLDHAQDEGFPRRGPETPYEYQRTLTPYLPDEIEAMTSLTNAFIVARYSMHPIEPDEVKRQRTNARKVQRALRQRHAEEHESSASNKPSDPPSGVS